MKKTLFIGFAVTLTLFFTACSANNEKPSIESEPPMVQSQAEPDSSLQSSSPVRSAALSEENLNPEPAPDTEPELIESPPNANGNGDSDTESLKEYQGLTQEQWSKLLSQKEEYGCLSKQEREIAQLNGEIECPEFKHLRWEHNIDGPLIYHVGVNEFEAWLMEIDSINNADQCNIYTFSEYFSISLDELVSLIETNGLTETYDVETVQHSE